MPGIDYTIGMNASGFNSGIQGVMGKLASLGGVAAKLTAGAGLAAGAGVMAIVAKSIGKAADMETLQTAFIPLLGGIQQAKDRITELSRFAAATPFEMPEIVQASKTLETLTRGALATGKGLTLVGDVASGTGADFSEVAVTIGRLYDGLDSGRPVGEAMARLQELGAISGATRDKLETLQKQGIKGREAWAVAEEALGRYSGGMKLQSTTWTGLLSTFKDTISMTMAEFGKPIMDALKPYLTDATDKLETFKNKAKEMGTDIGNAVRYARLAFEDGKFLDTAVESLKLGFMEAVNLMARGLQAAFQAATQSVEIKPLFSAFEALGLSIGNTIAAAVDGALSNVPGFGYLKENIPHQERRAKGYMEIAGMYADQFSLSDTAGEFAKNFQSAFASATGPMDTTGARKTLDDRLEAYKRQANAEQVLAEWAEEDAAAAVTKKKTTPTPPEIPTLRTAVTADRLSQIGGYVGGTAAALAQKAADKTAAGVAKMVSMMSGGLVVKPISSSGTLTF